MFVSILNVQLLYFLKRADVFDTALRVSSLSV